MKIITEAITLEELKDAAANIFGNFVKAVVDVEHEVINKKD